MFDRELKYIENDDFRKSVEVVINNLPEYFGHVAASSTGKYHPKFSLGDGGLVRHTKAAVRIAYELLQLEQYNKFESWQRDIIYGALIVHDGLKHGYTMSQYTQAEHPMYMHNFIEDLYKEGKLFCREDDMIIWSDAVASHMGQWNTSYKTGEEILPKPISDLEQFVHLCDYLASRKFLDIEFVNGEING